MHERLGKLFFQLKRKRSQIRSFKAFGSGEAVAAGCPVYHDVPKLSIPPCSFYAFYQFFELHGMKVRA